MTHHYRRHPRSQNHLSRLIEQAVKGESFIIAKAGKPLAPIHENPFDRILIAQAATEAMRLLTSDLTVAKYQGPVRLV